MDVKFTRETCLSFPFSLTVIVDFVHFFVYNNHVMIDKVFRFW